MLASKSRGVDVTLLETLVIEEPRVSEGHILHLRTLELIVNVKLLFTNNTPDFRCWESHVNPTFSGYTHLNPEGGGRTLIEKFDI